MKPEDAAFASDVVHGLSQAVTALEIGLEIGLRRDRTAAEMRQRMRTLLGVAQSLHRNLLELRAARDERSRNGKQTCCAGQPSETQR